MKKFTLIELIAVISILGILATMIIPNISSFQVEATETAIKADAKNLQTSVDMYQLDHYGNYPSEVQPEVGIPQPIKFDLLYPKYLREIPKHDGIYYWVDYQGKVWLSPFDSPVSVVNDGTKVSWTEVNGADYYNVFQVVDSTAGAVNQVQKLKFLEKVTTNEYSKDVAGKTFVVNAVNDKGFESAPVGSSYIGYPTTTLKDNSSNIKQITTGGHHSLVLMKDGTVKAWGYNGYGQLGDGTTTNFVNRPIVSSLLSEVKQIEAGGYHTTVLLNNGTLKAVGYNYYGQLANGTNLNSKNLVTIEGITNIQQISLLEENILLYF